MLTLTIPEYEFYDNENNLFYSIKEQTINLEHSLVSISKWESKFHTPFLTKELTVPEFIEYVKCMTITKNVNPMAYQGLTQVHFDQIKTYMEDTMTATWFSDKGPPNREIITAEIIYYWMFTLNIPMECQKWHFNRLITLIKVCSLKSAPPKKMSKSEILARNRALNAARRKKWNSKG